MATTRLTVSRVSGSEAVAKLYVYDSASRVGRQAHLVVYLQNDKLAKWKYTSGSVQDEGDFRRKTVTSGVVVECRVRPLEYTRGCRFVQEFWPKFVGKNVNAFTE